MGNEAEKRNYYEPLEIIKFEKISDDIHPMGRNLMVRICANLAKVVNGNRYYFYKEFEYTSNHYKKVSFKRGFDYYISIEEVVKPNGRDKFFVRIGPPEFIGFYDMIKEATKWFTGNKKLYGKKNGELIFAAPSIPSKTISGLPLGLSITLAPAIFNDNKPGVQIILDNGSNIGDFYMSVDHLFGVYGSLTNFNMFMSAQTMVSSIGIPLGTNRIDLSEESKSNPLPQPEQMKPDNSAIKGRLIGGVKTIDDLEG